MNGERSRRSPRDGRSARVVLAIESSGPGGAEQVVLHLAQALRARGMDVIVATQRPAWLTERLAQVGLPVWIDPQRSGWDPAWLLRFARRLRRERVDLLHAHEFAMAAFGGAAARVAGVPALATLHGRHWISGRAARGRALGLLQRCGLGLAAVSTDLAGYLAAAAGVSRTSIAVVENGIVPPARLGTLERARVRDEVRRELGLDPESPLVVAVGNLYAVKDHATLLRALSELDGVHLAIAGRGDERDALEGLAGELGIASRLHLLGLRDDVARWLAAADVFAHPSRSEELPLAVLEAMAAGGAVVATRVGGVPDAVVHEETGLLVEVGDAGAIAAAIASLLAAPERRRVLGEAARKRIEERFTVERMVERYLQLYRLP